MKKIIFCLISISLLASFVYSGPVLYRDLAGNTATVTAVDFSAKGGYLLSAGISGDLDVWDFKRNARLLSIKHGAPVQSAVFSPDGKYIASCGKDNTIKLWDLVGGGLVQSFDSQKDPVFCLAFSPDSKLLAAGGYKKAQIYDIVSQKKSDEVLTGDLWIKSLKFSDNGKYMAAGCGNTLKIWSIERDNLWSRLTGRGGLAFKEHRSLEHGTLINAVSFSKDSQYICSAGEAQFIKMWRAGDGLLMWTIVGHENAVLSASFSPDGKLLATGGRDNFLKVWNASDGKLLSIIAGYSSEVLCCAFSPDGDYLAAADKDGSLKIWSMNAGITTKKIQKGSYVMAAALIALVIACIAVFFYRKEHKKVKYWKP